VDDPPRRQALDELLAFAEALQRVVRFAELGQCPGGGRDRGRKLEGDVPLLEHRDPVLDQ